MKNKVLTAIVLVSILTMSCTDKNEDTNTDLNSLQPVKYDNFSEKKTSAKTGKTQVNPATGTTEFEYLTTVEKQETIAPLSLVSISNTDVIYPGSILRGSSFMNSKYDPLVLKNSFNPVTLSMTLRGNGLTTNVADPKPVLSEMRNAINTLMENNKGLINYEAVPAVFEYESTEIYNEQSFKKAFDVHADANVLGGLVSAKFGYTASSGSSSSSKHTVVKMRQWFYNFAIDPKYYTDWVNGDVNSSECGTHEPLYVSSVDYGRVAFIDIQNDKSDEYNKLMIEASVKVALKAVTGGASANYSQEFKALMTSGKIKFMIMGGPAQLAQQISSYEDFVLFVKSPSTANLVGSSIPISYKVRRLKDNTEVEVKDIFTSQYKEYKTN